MLMVSGVGPRDTLEKYGIPVVADRQGVSTNLWDHVLSGPTRRVNVQTHSALSNPQIAEQAAEEFRVNRTGFFTNTGSLLAWEKLPNHLRAGLTSESRFSLDAEFPSDWPEIEHLYIDAYLGAQLDSVLDAPRSPDQYGSIAAALITPFSRGNVTITSSDTSINPSVNPNWLSDPRDQNMAVQMFKRTRELFAADAVQPVIIGEEVYPGTNVSTDAEIMDFIRKSASTGHHAAATCKTIVSFGSWLVTEPLTSFC